MKMHFSYRRPLTTRTTSPHTDLRVLLAGLACLPLGLLLAGCSGANRPVHPGTTNTGVGARATGKVQLSVRWPTRGDTRLVPFAADSIRVRLTSVNGGSSMGEALLVRPSGGGVATASFDRLPPGGIVVAATAHPQADGTGVAQAGGQVTATVVTGKVTDVHLTLASTIDRVEVTPATVTLSPGQTAPLTATPKNAAGEVVLTQPRTLSFVSRNPGTTTVNAEGLVTALLAGAAVIEVTETESGKVGSATITVAPNNVSQTPTFLSPRSYTLPNALDSVVAGDFDGDGKADAAVNGGNAVYILYGKGDGTLETPVPLFTWGAGAGSGIPTRTAADIDKDGRLDLICVDTSNRVVLLRSLGNRAYAAPVGFVIGNVPGDVVAGDFDSDGRLDLAAATPGSSLAGDVNVLLNRSTPGNPSFTAPTRLGVSMWSSGVAVADWNGDNRLDLAAMYGSSTVGRAGVKLFWGNGSGGFTDGGSHNTATGSVVGALGRDFDADGKTDLVVLNYWDHNVGFLHALGGGVFTPQVTMSAAPYPLVGRAVDVNRDGRLDLVTANAGSNHVSILVGKGDGTFAAAVEVLSGGENTRTVDIADFNGDGKPDLVMQCESSRSVTLLINAAP